MLRRRFGRGERQLDSAHLACAARQRSHAAQTGRSASLAPLGVRSFILRIAKFSALSASLSYLPETSRAQQPDFSVYAHAVEFCRGNVKRPMALDPDKRILCFDGDIPPELDFSVANTLGANGLFVVRSRGGVAPPAIALANMMRDRRATVVVYDFCFSACAGFLLIASDEAFVMKDTLVAWHLSSWPPLCPSLQVAKDDGPKRLEKVACYDTSPQNRRVYKASQYQIDDFYSTRVVDPLFEHPPESFRVRQVLKMMFEETGRYPDILWTWNPRYYASTLKTKITYEAYPGSQDEVDALASKLRQPFRILYDP
jgi:hypothetical protein